MCKISTELTLCSCANSNAQKLQHYWVLMRYRPSDTVMMGEIMPPPEIDPLTDALNQKTLLKWLNKRNCFDKDMELQDKDVLELHFTIGVKEANDELVYCFEYRKQKWHKALYDPFNNNQEEVLRGKIKGGFGPQ